MVINKEKMDEINAVQYKIFKSFHSVCTQLNLKYYLVHGSLLGAYRYQGFFPIDDDIDVAMPRKDYDILMNEGKNLIGDDYFIQSHLSEKEYPLVFGKIRANNTAFVQPVLKKCNIHKGIYIDIFPIDNYPVGKLQIRWKKKLELMYNIRVQNKLWTNKKKSLKYQILLGLLKVIFPSWEKTRDKMCQLYSDVKETGIVIVRGGKVIEKGIPFSLFDMPMEIKFEDINSFAPRQTDQYLKLIYGDYMNYAPMEKDMVSENEVNISAEIVDTNKSYEFYK